MPRIGKLATLDHEHLMVQKTLRPTSPERSVFFVRFWELPLEWIFLSIIPGVIITVLFYFDHEISSIICTSKRYGVQKPGGYAWDVALLGLTTALCGILGVPPANGLLPQAPLHSESLMHIVYEEIETDEAPISDDGPNSKPVSRVYEQRFSHLLQAGLILAFVSPPFQWLLGMTPISVLSGLFMLMGYQSLSVNPMLPRLSYLVTTPSELPPLPPRVKSWVGVHTYTILQVAMTGVVFGVTLTAAAPAFPIIIIILVPVRLKVMNRLWSPETLRWVDGWACREGKPEDHSSSGHDATLFGRAGPSDIEKRNRELV